MISPLYIFFSLCYISLCCVCIVFFGVRDWIMGDSSASYIHMVQHLIEKCLIFHMSKEECMEALSKHASIEPVITSTGQKNSLIQYITNRSQTLQGKAKANVWNELEKENKKFFEAYSQSQSSGDRMSEAETSELIRKMIADSSKDSSDD